MRTIDQWLASDETGGAFWHCQRCKLPLLEITEPWLVNKEILQGECVLEYAICQPCRDQVTNEISEESKTAVREFLEKEINWDLRIQEFMLLPEMTERFDACIACREPRETLTGYGISALFDSGGKLIAGPLPLLICLPCIEKMTAGLRAEDRELWKRFLAENFEGPPQDSGFPGLL